VLLVLFLPVVVFYFSYSGRRKLFDIQVSKVQPSDADISPVARQSAGLWSQLHQQRRCRQLCTGHVHGTRHTEQLSFVDNYTHTHTRLFKGPFSRTTRVSWYQKGKTNVDFTEARDSEWQWHQLGRIHASNPPLKFFTGQMPFLPPNQQH